VHVLLHEDVVVLWIQGVEHGVDIPDRHHRAVHHDPVRRLRPINAVGQETHPDRIHGEARHKHQEKGRTLHRSSRVLRGEPSSAVFRASTGFDLRNAARKGLGE
jgi:hypothetical protein